MLNEGDIFGAEWLLLRQFLQRRNGSADWLPAASQGRHDRGELNVWRCGAKRIELRRVLGT